MHQEKKIDHDMFNCFSRGSDQAASRDREISSLRRQLDSTGEELTETGRSREAISLPPRRWLDEAPARTRRPAA